MPVDEPLETPHAANVGPGAPIAAAATIAASAIARDILDAKELRFAWVPPHAASRIRPSGLEWDVESATVAVYPR